MDETQEVKKDENRFKVIPNLSLKGTDVIKRLRNRTLMPSQNGQYSLDERIDEARRMNKADLINAYRENGIKLSNINQKLQENEQANQSKDIENEWRKKCDEERAEEAKRKDRKQFEEEWRKRRNDK